MFNIISHQGKQTKTLVIYHCTCSKMTKREKIMQSNKNGEQFLCLNLEL